MDREENRSFVLKSESLVKPEDVTPISFLGDFNKFLPKKTQHNIMVKGSRKIPYMGFIVDPYCFFLAYRIMDKTAAEAMLPEGYELAETSVFQEETKGPLVIISVFSARTSAFIGTRVEFYIIARNKESGLMSWVIAEYETDTNSHDPKNGFCGYTSDPSVFTTTPYGELIADFQSRSSRDRFAVTVDMESGKKSLLEESLWIEGNLSVDYGGKLKDSTSKPFTLIFDPFLMKYAQEIPIESVSIEANTYLNSIIDPESPLSAALFPYSQHFIIKQDLEKNEVTDEKGLHQQIQTFLKTTGFKTMAGSDIKKPLYRGILLSWLFNSALILFLLLKLLL